LFNISVFSHPPKLATYARDQSNKAAQDMAQYVLMKHMPHKLLFINNTTKKAFLIGNQEIIKTYDIAVRGDVDSDVANV